MSVYCRHCLLPNGGMACPGLDEDVDSGRWIEADMQTPQGYVITVVCVYVHAGNTDDPEKMKQKYRFLDTMLIRMEQLRDEAAHGRKTSRALR